MPTPEFMDYKICSWVSCKRPRGDHTRPQIPRVFIIRPDDSPRYRGSDPRSAGPFPEQRSTCGARPARPNSVWGERSSERKYRIHPVCRCRAVIEVGAAMKNPRQERYSPLVSGYPFLPIENGSYPSAPGETLPLPRIIPWLCVPWCICLVFSAFPH